MVIRHMLSLKAFRCFVQFNVINMQMIYDSLMNQRSAKTHTLETLIVSIHMRIEIA